MADLIPVSQRYSSPSSSSASVSSSVDRADVSYASSSKKERYVRETRRKSSVRTGKGGDVGRGGGGRGGSSGKNLGGGGSGSGSSALTRSKSTVNDDEDDDNLGFVSMAALQGDNKQRRKISRSKDYLRLPLIVQL